jgi:hypothetical protein
MMTAVNTATRYETAVTAFPPIHVDLLDTLVQRADRLARADADKTATPKRVSSRRPQPWHRIFFRQQG